MKIQYIGEKDRKVDNVAGTGLVWHGNGDVQDVPDGAAARLLAHGSVWRKEPLPQVAQEPERAVVETKTTDGAVEKAADQQQDQKAGESETKEPRWVLVKNENDHIVLDAMDDEALRAFADQHQIKVDGRIKGDKLRQAIYEAATKEAPAEQ